MENNFQHGGITVFAEKVENTNALKLNFRGFLDKSTVKPAEEYVMKCVGGMDQKYLIFDFSGLTYINSEGIGFLMMTSTHLTKNEKEMFIVSPASQVVDIFDAIGLGNAIKCFKNMQECEAHISSL